MQIYVIGFLFDELGNVLLIRKEHPSWQRGRLNGVGGKVEQGEKPDAAMVREFKEETGCLITSWRQFGKMIGNGYEIYLYNARDHEAKPQNLTDETLFWCHVSALPENCLPTLKWLVPMAAYLGKIYADMYHPEPEC